MSLGAQLVKRIREEVPTDTFLSGAAEKEFMNAANYLKNNLKATDDDIITMLHGLYDVMEMEYMEGLDD